jgi:DNA-binding CsgD family transcriptional regulator
MSQGRSLDSCRFLSKRLFTISDHLPHEGAWNEEIVEQCETETSIESDICARDAIVVLKSRINSLEKEIITYLVEGFGIREIARRIGVSHVCVLNHRSTIAKVAIGLGICLARHTCAKSSKMTGFSQTRMGEIS